MTNATDFLARIYCEAASDNTVVYGGKTKVEISPRASEVTPELMRDKDPVRNPRAVQDWLQQNGPTNPGKQSSIPQRIADMWNQSLEAQTKRAQRLQRPPGGRA
jgi:hypothetical protein